MSITAIDSGLAPNIGPASNSVDSPPIMSLAVCKPRLRVLMQPGDLWLSLTSTKSTAEILKRFQVEPNRWMDTNPAARTGPGEHPSVIAIGVVHSKGRADWFSETHPAHRPTYENPTGDALYAPPSVGSDEGPRRYGSPMHTEDYNHSMDWTECSEVVTFHPYSYFGPRPVPAPAVVRQMYPVPHAGFIGHKAVPWSSVPDTQELLDLISMEARAYPRFRLIERYDREHFRVPPQFADQPIPLPLPQVAGRRTLRLRYHTNC